MNSKELAKILKVHETTVTRKVKKALEDGRDSVVLDGRFFRFEVVRGDYVYEEIFEKKVDSGGDVSVWMLADEKQRELASKRLKIVKLYRNRPSNETWKKFLQRVEYRYRDIKPTKNKLFRWLERVRWCEENDKNPLEYLLDARGKSSKNRSYSEEHYEFVSRLFLEDPDRSLMKIHMYLQEEFGKGCVSYATVSRMLKRFKSENILKVSLATSPKDTNNKLRPAPGNASEEAVYNNALWEMDGTPVDVICSDGIRYQLSAAIDVYSRRVVVVVTPTANSSALARVFKKGIQKLGIPERVKLDNGKEYKSLAFEYTCARLKIEQNFTMPYSGWQKPHIERFFGTLTRDLFEELPGYIGHSVSDRARRVDRATYEKHLEAKKKAQEVLRGGNSSAKKLAKAQKDMDIYLPTTLSREELEKYIDRWIVRYENKIHSGIRQTPLERWNECGIPTQTISDERVLDVLVGLSEKKRVTKKGVTWKKITYWADELYDRVGQSVWVLSDDELGYLYIYDLEMKFLCKAENAEWIGKSRSEYLASRFFDKKSQKIIKELNELRREAPERYKLLLADENEKGMDTDIGVEFKSEIVDSIRDSVSTHTDEEKKELKDKTKQTVVIGGRPIFGSVIERFAWDLDNDMVDESTKKLAKRHSGLWALAYEEYENRKVG